MSSAGAPRRRHWLLGLLLHPARNAERVIALAYGLAVVGLALPLLFGFDGSATVLGVSVALLFLSFLALFYCAFEVTTAASDSSEGRR